MIDLEALVKNKDRLVRIDERALLKLTRKCYSKLFKISQNRPTNLTQN